MAMTKAETWTGANGAAWPAQWTTAGTGTADIQSNQGRLLPGTGAFAVGPTGWLTGISGRTDFDFMVDVNLVGTTTEQYVMLCATSDGSTGGDGTNNGYSLELAPSGSAWNLWVATGGAFSQLGVNQSFTFPAGGTAVHVRFKKVASTISAWISSGATALPVTPSYTQTDSSFNTAMKPFFMCTNGSATTARAVTFDNFYSFDGGGLPSRVITSQAVSRAASF